MALKFKLQIVNDDLTVSKEKSFKSLKEIAEFLNIDYQTCNKFYKLCGENEPKIKGLHSLMKTLYNRYRIVDNRTVIVDFD